VFAQSFDEKKISFQLVIFNHPDNVQSLSIHGGSGFFDVVTLTGDKIIDHKYHVNNQSVAVIPSVVGETTLSVKDLCLVSCIKAFFIQNLYFNFLKFLTS